MGRLGFVVVLSTILALKFVSHETNALTIDVVDIPAEVIPKVKITLFYESYCPYSVRFITHQLLPATMKYGEHLALDLIPFGNCKSSQEPDGDWDFKCQHGAKECYGNRVHACVIEQGRDKSAAKTVAALACLVHYNYSDADVQQCLEWARFSWDRHRACMQRNATALEVAYGRRTHSNVPKVQYVPFLMFDGAFNATLEELAVNDLELVVCRLLGRSRPKQCPTYNRL